MVERGGTELLSWHLDGAFESVDELTVNFDRERRRITEQEAAIDKLSQLLQGKKLELDQLRRESEDRESQLLEMKQRLPCEQQNLQHSQRTLGTLKQTRDLLEGQLQQTCAVAEQRRQRVQRSLQKAQDTWERYHTVYMTSPAFRARLQAEQRKAQLQELAEQRDALNQQMHDVITDQKFIVRMVEMSVECKSLEAVIQSCAEKKAAADQQQMSADEDEEMNYVSTQASEGFQVSSPTMFPKDSDPRTDIVFKEITALETQATGGCTQSDGNCTELQSFPARNAQPNSPEIAQIEDNLEQLQVQQPHIKPTARPPSGVQRLQLPELIIPPRKPRLSYHNTRSTSAPVQSSANKPMAEPQIPQSDFQQLGKDVQVNNPGDGRVLQDDVTTRRKTLIEDESFQVQNKRPKSRIYWMKLPDEPEEDALLEKNGDNTLFPAKSCSTQKNTGIEQPGSTAGGYSAQNTEYVIERISATGKDTNKRESSLLEVPSMPRQTVHGTMEEDTGELNQADVIMDVGQLSAQDQTMVGCVATPSTPSVSATPRVTPSGAFVTPTSGFPATLRTPLKSADLDNLQMAPRTCRGVTRSALQPLYFTPRAPPAALSRNELVDTPTVHPQFLCTPKQRSPEPTRSVVSTPVQLASHGRNDLTVTPTISNQEEHGVQDMNATPSYLNQEEYRRHDSIATPTSSNQPEPRNQHVTATSSSCSGTPIVPATPRLQSPSAFRTPMAPAPRSLPSPLTQYTVGLPVTPQVPVLQGSSAIPSTFPIGTATPAPETPRTPALQTPAPLPTALQTPNILLQRHSAMMFASPDRDIDSPDASFSLFPVGVAGAGSGGAGAASTPASRPNPTAATKNTPQGMSLLFGAGDSTTEVEDAADFSFSFMGSSSTQPNQAQGGGSVFSFF